MRVLALCALLVGCAVSPPERVIPVSYSTPAMLLTSLKAAAERSMNEYYDRLQAATDCEVLPGVCRLFAARESAAGEMALFYHAIKGQFGAPGARAAGEMIAGAFGAETDALKHASVHAGRGDLAVMRIGEDIYRLRRRAVGWRIVQAPELKRDPIVTAEAIELLAARVERVRIGIVAGRYSSIDQVLAAMERVFTPRG